MSRLVYPFLLELAVKAFDLIVKEVTHIFEYRYSIGKIDRILPYFQQAVEDLLHVGEVKIACHYKASRTPVVFSGDGVNIVDVVTPVGAVTQVSEIDIAGVGHCAGNISRVAPAFLTGGAALFYIEIDLSENFFYRISRIGPLAEDIPGSGSGADADTREASAILSPVMLFLHHEIHLLQSVVPRSVFINIESRGFQQSHKSYPAFVFYTVTHCLLC